MSFQLPILDRYLLRQMLGTMFSVLAVVMALMTLEHLPRLLEITRVSGQSGYIVVHTVAGLLPEYGGIGLLVGLFLGIALTIRKLALRGELDVIEACGIAPFRWMRFPFALAVMVSILTIINQGWLMPAGEIKIAEIGKRMKDGEFGHRLRPGEFIDLGAGSVLHFQKVDAVNGGLIEVFLRIEGNVFTASRGRLWQLPSGATTIELRDGQIIQERDAKVFEFSRLKYSAHGLQRAPKEEPEDKALRQVVLGALWADGTTPSRSAVYGRCLWAVLALVVPQLAFILGRPARRQSGAVGIFVGVIFLVLGIKMITPLMDGFSSEPELLATGILAAWSLFVSSLIRAEKVFGQGFVDLWASRAFKNFRWPRT